MTEREELQSDIDTLKGRQARLKAEGLRLHADYMDTPDGKEATELEYRLQDIEGELDEIAAKLLPKERRLYELEERSCENQNRVYLSSNTIAPV
jgi:hypothetical protein